MRKKATAILFIGLIFILAAAVQAAPLAYSLSWWTADAGGGDSLGNSYHLSATTGQPDAGTLRGGSFTLAGGFWSGAPSAPIQTALQVWLPLLMR